MSKQTTSEIKLQDLEATKDLGRRIASGLKGGEVIELIGDLGSGKTSLVKGIVEGLGSKQEATSPSFTICNEYTADRLTIYHFDFYRLSDPGIISRELGDVINHPDTIVITEWAESVENILPENRIIVTLKPTAEDGRVAKLVNPGKK